MKHGDEHTPIRDRWTSRQAGKDDEAAAGALLRTAGEHGPIDDGRLAEIHARLRRSRRARAIGRPAPRWLRQLAFAGAFVLGGGVLSASVMHVMRKPPKPPEAAPAPAGQKRAQRSSSGHRGPVESVAPAVSAPEVPEAQAPAPITPPQPVPSIPTPPLPSSPEAQAPAASARPRAPHRSLAINAIPGPVPAVAPTDRPMSSRIALPTTPSGPSPLLAPADLSRPLIPAPSDRPFLAALPPPPQPLPIQPEPSRLARESRWLAAAIAKLRQEGQPEQALVILDQHQSELGSGPLSAETNATRIEALLRLGRNAQALTILDGQRLSAQGLEREMLVARAELRAEKGRTWAAINDFDSVLSSPGRIDAIAERALYGRATCRAKSGEREGARGDLTRYLELFPQGRFAQAARSALSQQLR
jgi:hypothetical protein